MTPDEINQRFRKKDIERWQQSPFVLGYEVKLSKNSKLQLRICQELTGTYPKWFLYTGWGDGCGCFLIPILASKEEYDKYEDAILAGTDKDFQFKSMVTDVPENFKQWIRNNQDLTPVPDFVNANFVNCDIKKGLIHRDR